MSILARFVLFLLAGSSLVRSGDVSRFLQARPKPSSKYFVWMTDAHADPYYGTVRQQCSKETNVTEANPFGVMGCDPPYALMESAVAAAARHAGRQAEFILFTGDFSRHDMEKMPDPAANVSSVIGDVSRMLREVVPEAGASVGVLGNDDNPANYYTNITTDSPRNPWFVRVGEEMTHADVMTRKVFRDYEYGSYFEVEVGGLRVLNLCTVMYSVKAAPESQRGQEADPFGQFAWLQERLAQAAREGRRVWIVGHIPPGIETFGYTELWQEQYLRRYLEILASPLGSVVAAQLFGHVHKDEFRLLPIAPPDAGPMFLSSSISPVYYNNPSFKLVEYCSLTGNMLSYKVFFADMPEPGRDPIWRFGYDLVQTYRQQLAEARPLSMASLARVTSRFPLGLQEYTRYATWYATNYSNDLEEYSTFQGDPELNGTYKLSRRLQYVCAMTVEGQGQYEACLYDRALPPLLRDARSRPACDFKYFKGAVASLPKTWDALERFAVGRLLSQEVFSRSALASEICELLKEHAWDELLILGTRYLRDARA